jgi:nitrate reductase gamma subunit
MVVGGIAGLIAIIGLTILLHRRLSDPRIRLNSRKWDIAVAIMLWLQLALGLLTVPFSAFHMDGALFETLSSYVKGIVTLDGGSAAVMTDVPLTYKLHILLGFTIFLVSPFTRMIHIWSGAAVLPIFSVCPARQRVGGARGSAHSEENHLASDKNRRAVYPFALAWGS